MKRIFDPVHHFIELSTAEAQLLDLPALQRLRRLRQLGLAYLAFPAAEHSRFSHALGALAMGSRAFDGLCQHARDFFTGDADAAYQRRLVRIALLLHDVGHGPFSHSCEPVLGIAHEARTRDILALPDVAAAIARADVETDDVLALIVGDRASRYPALRELVSGPNLDADRMDYLQRDAYFTGVATGRYDAEQLVASLRILQRDGEPIVGIDRRGVVALESFVMARYMMFASVYFHHTTRMFEHMLHDVLRRLWPDPRKLDSIEEFLAWDDFRVLGAVGDERRAGAAALRDRVRAYALAAEFNAERDLDAFDACHAALLDRLGEANVWADSQSQLLHRLPFGLGQERTVWVDRPSGAVDARQASDVIAKLSGKAYWRKLFIRRTTPDDVRDARRICADVIGGLRTVAG
ncbi:MAG: HD domain-containing protein [Candidatus Eremiobacteraeota bacterium]|nr:HD domain-containing protein [Candidatus Eremiobacteraeota bacterium]